ncbi:hypothetical protein O181_022584 [Austropuccinia psidii MF-1]|uniref:Uncharacterized protein n=1 Tax=Austropuccinia psidii MF-1 TaxID=1389203 RepID=A0A9Q3CF26_9BASI|nr:hypothetical protein [Austropuccinia psidii MF-1]
MNWMVKKLKLLIHLLATQPPVKKFHSHLIPSTPKNFQPVLSSLPSSIPPPSPKSSTFSPSLASPMKPSPIPQPRPSTITICFQHHLKRRSLVPFAILCFSIISKLGVLANQGYQIGSNCGELSSRFCAQIIQEGL